MELVQESAPERSDFKLRLIAEASRAAAPETLIASSSSSVPHRCFAASGRTGAAS
ncbi:3-hydroxyacyl-CoA dehydrogenase NAD-binding domain-containing protein [Mesorhizobium sp. IMUNJ 23033]|uniref:3-hydroxyacyl-CoA dehydrogenase NAD-binding domain-containing protein n=1 Tax=Mesorhizobium sp. IMUNJ 23033 TaxID=3378039 RepID=UPI00385135C2